MIVSMQIVVLPVERSPMISSRWPRPIGIIASMAMMPVCTGWLDRAPPHDARARAFRRDRLVSLAIGPLPSSGSPSVLTTRPSRPLPTGTCRSLPGRADFVALLELRVVAEDDHADFGFVEIERETGDAVAEVEHLVQHHVREPFDLGDAVADLADDADGLLGGRGLGAGDLRFDFLDQVSHEVLIPAAATGSAGHRRASSAASWARTLPS